MQYPVRFKEAMVKRMAGVDAISANALSEESGVAQSTLSRWLRNASVAAGSHGPESRRTFSEMIAMSPKRPQDWTAEEKLAVVLEAASLPDEELGAFLRGKGLHETHLKQWRSQILGALQEGHGRKPKKQKFPESKRIKELERELLRKEKALAEAAALLVLKKKAEAIWGDEDEGTPGKSGK